MTISDKITSALDAHDQWLTRLRAAMAMGGSELRVEDIRDDRQCEFGQWVQVSDIGSEFETSQHFRICVELHGRMHMAAADVVGLVLAGKAYPAPELMEAAQLFRKVSQHFAKAMRAWQEAEVPEPVSVA